MVTSDTQTLRYRVGEEWREDSSAGLPVISPVDGSTIGTVHEFSHDEIDEVFATAKAGQRRWGRLPVIERADLLHKFADALEAAADEMTPTLMMEISKAKKDARDEIVRSADYIRHTAEDAKRMVGESQFSDSFPGQKRNKISLEHRVPLGVVLAIPPFNYPVNLACSKIAPGLVAGNVVILKPPSQGVLSGLRMAELAHEAGIPADVFQVVTGRGSRIGDYLTQHPAVDTISFTGSSETGRALAQKSGMIPVMLELGGKDAAIVLSDADLEAAAKDIVAGAFSYSGQRCTAVKRVLVMQGVGDRLVELIGQEVGKLTVGMPQDNAQITPLVDASSAEGAIDMVEAAAAAGATVVTGGTREGNLVQPTVVDHVSTDLDIAWVEPFAPVLPVIRVSSPDEAIRISNDSEYGLQGAIFTNDIDIAIQIANRLDVGTVQVNGRTARGPDHFPFLGTKSSGMGTQGTRPSIEAMTRVKSLVINLREKDLKDTTL